jgi:hypothetical protein
MTTTEATKLASILNAPLHQTGLDIPEGSYPGTLFGFGEPTMIPVAEQFRKPGGPTATLKFEMRFGLRVKDSVQEVAYLVPVPEGGSVNRRSNLFKACRGMRPDLFNHEGAFNPGVTLQSFVGSGATVQVKKNKKDFPQVEAVAAPMQGVVCPTIEECAVLAASSDGIPF